LSKSESLILKKEIQDFDPDAFVFIHDNIEVIGNFKMRLN
ncbi:MAG: DUF2179 domain-containing protein, partial [Eubacterium sp.]